MLKKVISSLFLLLALSPFSVTEAQQPPAAAAPAGARPIVNPVGGVPTAPTLTPPASTGIPATGGTCIGVNCIYPATANPATVNPVMPATANPYALPYPYYMPPPPPTTPPMNIWTAISQTCFALSSAMYQPPERVRRTRDALKRANDSAGFIQDPEFPEVYARRAGRELYDVMSDAGKACQKFIDQNGNIGPWGRSAKEELNRHKDVFEDHVPADITKFCPNFPHMTPERRKLFWLWVLASMSAPESSCNPNEQSGDAIGLFQLDEQGCRVAGVHLTSYELRDPYENIRCAVARLAFEMRHRDTLLASHSRDKTGTYWAVLRGRSAAAIDQKGAMRTMELLPKYSDCQLGSEGPTAMAEAPPSPSAE